MDVFFADDARQAKCSRRDVGPLVAIGGVYVPGHAAGDLEREIQAHCQETGFPDGQVFKWSPGRRENQRFMRNQLKDDARVRFYEKLFELVGKHESRAVVVIEDESRGVARQGSFRDGRYQPGSKSREEDVTALFLERCDLAFGAARRDGIVVFSKPSGGSKEEGKFVTDCIELQRKGTEYRNLQRLPLGVVTAPFHQMRLLQLADVVASCVTARVSGESDHTPRVFEMIKPVFRKEMGCIGGAGLKIHPDLLYANLYHWLVGDELLLKGTSGHTLPVSDRPYYEDAGEAAYPLRS